MGAVTVAGGEATSAGEGDVPGPAAAIVRPRFFAGTRDEPRSRRASDVLTLAGAVLGLALVGAVTRPQPGVERRLMAFVSSLPHGMTGVWRVSIAALAMWALLLLVVSGGARRWAVARDLLLAGITAVVVSLLLTRLVLGSWPPVWDSLRALGPARYFPPLSLALPVAVTLTASPHVSEPVRRVGRWLIVATVLGTVAHQSAAPTGAVAAVLVGAAAAAVLHLWFGSCRGRPSLADVAVALADLGVQTRHLGMARRQRAGLFLVSAVAVESSDDAGGEPLPDLAPDADREPARHVGPTEDGPRSRLLVKVYGRDAHDTALLTTVWRTVWYREPGSPVAFGRRAQVEHEAFLSLLAAQGGVRTQPVVTAGATTHGDVLLVLAEVGERFADREAGWTEALAGQAWQTLARVHGAGIGHGQVDDEHLIIDAERVGLVDFRSAIVAPSADRLRTDRAQLLVSTVLALGAQTALPIAVRELGQQGLIAALPLVQSSALTARQRAAVRADGLDLDQLRAQAAEATDTTAPELQRVHRVSRASLLQIVLLAGAFVAVAAVVGGLDLDALGEQLQHATVWLIVAAMLLAQLPRLTAAVSVLGAAPSPLPLGPVYALQLATSYLTLAVPTSAARFAVTIRFLQRHGLRADTALVVSAIDTFGQTAVQLALLAALLLLTPATLHLELGGAIPQDMGWLIVIVALAALVAVAVVLCVRTWRRAITNTVRRLAHASLEAVRGLRSPRRLALLLSGNISTELVFALTLQTLARSFGYQLGIAEILVITISVRVLTGVVPIPGGIGVAESGLAFGLVRAGMPEDTAFAAVLLYRLATFYLPPLWGFFALRWLEHNKHL